MNGRMIMSVRKIARQEPIRVRLIAFWASPFSKNRWVGWMDRAVSSSGAPKNVEGMKSMKVCVIDIATIKTIMVVGVSELNKNAEERIRREEMRFM